MDSTLSRKDLLIGTVLFVAFAAILHFMGRVPWCECGIGLLTMYAWSSETSQHFLDPYSISHILHGIIFYWVLGFIPNITWKQRLLGAFLIEAGWEILENSPVIIERYRSVTASLDYFGDSILNSVGDILSCLLGFWIAMKAPWKITLTLFLIIEIGMLILWRDNLTLNIIMLIYPIDAIRNWQVLILQ